MTDVRFQRTIDQKLYDELCTAGVALTQASELIRQGANVNALCDHPDLKKATMLVSLFDELMCSPSEIRVFFLNFFLKNGLSLKEHASEAITFLMLYAFPTNDLLEGAKLLLKKGADPSTAVCVDNQLDGCPITQSAINAVLTQASDAWLLEKDFPLIQGYSALYEILLRAVKKQNYQTVGLLTEIVGQQLKKFCVIGKAKVRTVKPDCKWEYEGEYEANLFDSGFVLQCSQSDLCVNLIQEAFCVDAAQGMGMKTFFNFPNEYTESVITAITGRIDNTRACLNLVLSNGYCVQFKTEFNHAATQTRRGTIELKPITDELSDKYQNANELTKPQNTRGY